MAKTPNTIARDFDSLIRKATKPPARRRARGGGRRAVQHEKFEQQKGVDLLRSIGGRVYVFGTRRSNGTRCTKCGEFVPNKDRGTRQSEGIPDVLAFLPVHSKYKDLVSQIGSTGHASMLTKRALWWEAKRPGGGAESDDQAEFRQLCADSSTDHCLGDVDDLMVWLVEHGHLDPKNLPHYRRAAIAIRLASGGRS